MRIPLKLALYVLKYARYKLDKNPSVDTLPETVLDLIFDVASLSGSLAVAVTAPSIIEKEKESLGSSLSTPPENGGYGRGLL
jgi:hypothetical protein